MSRIGAVGGGSAILPARTARNSSDFTVAPEMETASATAASAPARVALAGLLAETIAPEPSVRDRLARARGHGLLRALSGLQAAMLSGTDGSGASLRDLAAALEATQEADDPRLAEALAQVKLRAAIELARHGTD